MWNKKQINKTFLSFSALFLLIALLAGSGLYAAEEDKPKDASAAENKQSVDEESSTPKVEKELSRFVATEEVSADQAVSFPTDI